MMGLCESCNGWMQLDPWGLLPIHTTYFYRAGCAGSGKVPKQTTAQGEKQGEKFMFDFGIETAIDGEGEPIAEWEAIIVFREPTPSGYRSYIYDRANGEWIEDPMDGPEDY